jgi:hypothetical protein
VCFTLSPYAYHVLIVVPAKFLVEEAVSQKAVSLITKDVSWLWRMAYNLAVQGCSDWEEQYVTHAMELFGIAKEVNTLLFPKGEC